MLLKKTYWLDFSDFPHSLLPHSTGCRSWTRIGEDCYYDICNLCEGQSREKRGENGCIEIPSSNKRKVEGLGN